MTAQRFSFYKHIHKAIRAVAHDMVGRAQRTDFTQPSQVEELARAVEDAFSFFEGHAAKETEYITPVLRVCAPSLATDSDLEHREQELRLRDLRRALLAAGRGGPSAAALGHAFVVGLSRFEGEMLVHMADEEERLMPALWAALDDEALERIHESLLASIPQADKARVIAWMLPAISAPERVELLVGIRASAPPQAFSALRGLAQRVLAPADWDRLEADLHRPTAA